MKPTKLALPALACLALLLCLSPGTRAGEAENVEDAAPPLDLDVLTARIAADVERVRGRPFKQTPKAVFMDPMQMMGGMPCGGPGGPGGGMPPGGAMGGPGGSRGVSPFDMFQMMGRSIVGCAALGLIPEDAATPWIGEDGTLTMPNPWELFGGPNAGGPAGGMPGLPPMPGMSGPGGGDQPEGIMGAFYRDDAGLITVMKRGSDLDRALVERILAHELTHALDDQYHDISRYTPMAGLEGDAQLAAQSLVEGSAAYTELDWTTRVESQGRIGSVLENEELARYGGYLNEDGSPAPRKMKGRIDMGGGGPMQGLPGVKEMPGLFAKRAVFPYAYGFEFVKHLRQNGVPVDRAYEDLPTTSEQIMHPERYLATPRDEPTEVDVVNRDALLGAVEAKILDDRMLGEFITRALLEDHAVEGAAAAAAGWDGDRLLVLTVEKKLAFLWVSTWDSEADAAEFEKAMRALLAAKYADTSLVLRDGADVVAARGLGEALTAAVEARGAGGLVARATVTATSEDFDSEEEDQ